MTRVTGSTAPPDRPAAPRRAPLLAILAVAAALLPGGIGTPAAGSDQPVADGGVIHLTFDDGPHWMFTPLLLDLLDDYGARATFFPTAESLVARWDVETTQALLSRGHAVGNHTWHHADLSKLPKAGALAEVERASSGLASLLGYRPTCLRAPYGEFGEIASALGPQLGMTVAGWTADPQEWRDPDLGWVDDYLHRRERDGMVVLLHDRKWLTLHIAERILEEYSQRGWSFEVLPGCVPGNAMDARIAAAATSGIPVGALTAATTHGSSLRLEGWAYDGNLPDGGLLVIANVDGIPVEAAATGADHRFSAVLDSEGVRAPVCAWAGNVGPNHHPAALGCVTPGEG